MKAFAFLLLALCFGANATDIQARISVTSGASSTCASNAAVTTAITNINALYATQSISVSIVPTIGPATGAPGDSSPALDMFKYMNQNKQAWQDRYNADFSNGGASMGIIVWAPADVGGVHVPGLIPDVPPTKTYDSTAAVNCNDLQNQMELAISRILGTTGNTDGYAARWRSYAYQGDNVCYHTRTSGGSDPSTQIPYLSGWDLYNKTSGGIQTSNTASGSSQQTCELFREDSINTHSAGCTSSTCASALSTGDNGSTATCNLKNASGVTTVTWALQYFTVTGSSTLLCGVAGDFELTQYSCPPGQTGCSPYLGRPIGDATHNAVGDINNRISQVISLRSNTKTLWEQAKGSLVPEWVQMLMP